MENTTTTSGSKYEKEVIEVMARTKARAFGVIIIEGEKGSTFEVRAVDTEYLKRMPRALIELASRIEGELAKAEMEKLSQEHVKKKSRKKNDVSE